jgi:TM2 domain-containing membrane protein YozV
MKCVHHPDIDATTKCLSCGVPICEICRVESKNEDYCKKCIVDKVEGAIKNERAPILAAALSFVIGGAGQLYNGQIGKGILIFFTSWLLIPWIYGVFDAYNTAKKINEGTVELKPQTGCLPAVAVVVLLLFLMVPIVGLMAAIAVPNFVKARHAAMRGAGSGGTIKIDIDKFKVETTTATDEPKPKKEDGGSHLDKIIQLNKRVVYKIYMKNSHVFEASIDKETPDSYIFRIGNGTFQVSKDDIEEIRTLE